MTKMPTRRRLFRTTAIALLGAGAARGAIALPGRAAVDPARMPDAASAPADATSEVSRLAFVNTHTGEALDVVYREGGRYLTDALSDIDRVLRDHRSGDVHPIDRALLEQLTMLGSLLGTGGRPFHVISGYRSPRTNAMLAARSGGVATRSLHLTGRAIDVRLPGMPLTTLHRAALGMQAGGVGYYARSNFVHLDTGRVRRW